jgi:hypothetical protein
MPYEWSSLSVLGVDAVLGIWSSPPGAAAGQGPTSCSTASGWARSGTNEKLGVGVWGVLKVVESSCMSSVCCKLWILFCSLNQHCSTRLVPTITYNHALAPAASSTVRPCTCPMK